MTKDVKLRQSLGLRLLVFTEFWERFGYYTVLSILVLYATKSLAIPDARADVLFGSFTGLIFAMPVIGGIVADRLLGFGRAIMVGAFVLAIGYTIMAGGTEDLLYLGLAVMFVGSGLFRPSVAGLVGALPVENDLKRDQAYMWLYAGTNAGAFLGMVAAGFVSETVGYSAAFLMAGIGKVIALVTFFAGRSVFKGRDGPPADSHRGPASAPGPIWFAIGAMAVAAVGYGLLRSGSASGFVLLAAAVGFYGYFLVEVRREDLSRRRPLYALLVLFAFVAAFVAAYEQFGASIILFVDQLVDRNLAGTIIPASAFLALNPLLVVLLAPVFSWLWIWLSGHNIEPSEGTKFSVGFFILGAAFFLLRFAIAQTAPDEPVAAFWMVAFLVLYSLAEMFIFPVGLALVSRLAPQRLMGFAMGLWFMVNAIANFAGGLLAVLAVAPRGSTPSVALRVYGTAFADYGLMLFAAGSLLLLLLPTLKRLMGPDRTRLSASAERTNQP